MVDLSRAFVASLAGGNAFDTILPSTHQMPLATRVAITTGRATGNQVGEGQLKLCSQLELANPTLSPKRCAVVLVVSNELMRLAGSEGAQLMRTELQQAVGSATDEVLISTVMASVTPIASSGDPLVDFASMAEAIETGAGSKLWIICSPLNCKRLAFARTTTGAPKFETMTPSGGTISGVQVIPSGISDTEVLMLDGSALGTNAGQVLVGSSGEALIQMEDESGPETIDCYGRNMLALRAERVFAVESLRTNGAAAVSGVDYGVNV